MFYFIRVKKYRLSEEDFLARKKKRSIGRTIGLIVKLILALFLMIVVLGATLFYLKYGKRIMAMQDFAKTVVSESTKDTFRQTQTSIVYDSNGEIMSRLKGAKDVYYIKYSDIPKKMIDAITSIEDKNFFEHGGYDLKAILRAGLAYIKNRGVITQGGSTITQQLARNIFLNFEESFNRKIKELFIAIELEKKYTKAEIMEFYLNNIYFANGYYGVQSASLGYFGKGVNMLSLSEMAFILAIPNSPTRYNPYENLKGTKERRNRILEQMYKDGKIDEKTLIEAKKEKIKLVKNSSKNSSYALSYALDCAVRSVMKSEGFAFRYNFSDKNERKRYEESYNQEYERCQAKLYSGGYRIYTSIDMDKQKLLQETIDNGLMVSTEKSSSGIYKLQGAAVTIDNDSGQVVAIVGGRSQNLSVNGFNRAYQSHRQPGSTIKPLIIYLPAFERGYRPESIVKDEKIEKGPVNADGRYDGNITMLDAIARSKNTIPWKLFLELSPAFCIGKLIDMEFSEIEESDYYPAASLGGLTKGVSAVEMAGAYASIENGGYYREPTCITKLTDSDGNDIVSDTFYHSRKSKYVYDETATKMMTLAMEEVMKRGTGRYGRLEKMPCAGKTGTTNNAKDLWFVGFTKYYTTSFFVGYDFPKSLNGLKFSATPLSMWKTYMEEIHAGLDIKNLDSYEMKQIIPDKEEKEEKVEEIEEVAPRLEEEELIKEENEKKDENNNVYEVEAEDDMEEVEISDNEEPTEDEQPTETEESKEEEDLGIVE